MSLSESGRPAAWPSTSSLRCSVTRYLSVDDVLELHRAEVGEDLPFDFGLLESAVARPMASFGGQG